jgi:hypothetical protein
MIDVILFHDGCNNCQDISATMTAARCVSKTTRR